MKEKISEFFDQGDTFSTKELAIILQISTPKAYNICVQLESEEVLFKYGYKTKHGWEDVNSSKLRPSSLYWQVI